MSDGPHRSLPMRPGWKKVAEYAANEAFATNEICDVIVAAFEQDCRKDIPASLVSCIQDVLGGATLFSEDNVWALEDLRPSVAGCAMSNALLDHVIYAVGDGKSGDAALQEAIHRTATDWSARCARQVEEHYLREASTENAKNVRSRIEDAIQQASFSACVGRLLDSGSSKPSQQIVKRDGLDDGAPL